MWPRDRAGRIGLDLALELRVLEGGLEIRDALPDGVVHKGRAFADPAGGDSSHITPPRRL